MVELTPRQRRILDFIAGAVRGRGQAPTYREIGRRFGIASTNGVRDHLKALARKGLLAILPNRRGVRLADGDEEAGTLPILGRVPAGTPALSEEFFDDRLNLPSFFGSGANLFGLRVKGESMVNAGIRSGDYVVVRSQSRLDSGTIGVVVVEGEATVKRIYDEGKSLRLQPENDAMKPIRVPKGEDVRIVGKVVGVIRKI